jgi:hypothetical protein
MPLPEQYVASILHQYCRSVHYIKHSSSYRASCPFCHEGNSQATKTRLNYYVNKDYLVCYNCSKSFSGFGFVRVLTGKTAREIFKEVSEGYDTSKNITFEDDIVVKKKEVSTLPINSINLTDPIQIKYYENESVIKDALKYVTDRRLLTAINKTPLYLSLVDYLHANRLIIPFLNINKKISFYQTRAIYKKDEYPAKYLGKLNSPKSVFGLNNVTTELDYLFIFEGPIDSMFVKNGISMAGLQISDYQKDLLQPFFLYKKIWVLDNQLDNENVIEKNHQLIDQGETVFIWPKKYHMFKDVNEICCKLKVDSIHPDFFIKNAYNGLQAKTILSTI